MKATSFADKIWLVVAGVLIILTLVSIVQALAAEPRQIYEQGREALNKSDYRSAADLFEKAYAQEPQGELAGEALYWHAFSLYREGESSDLRRAARLLQKHIDDYEDASTVGDASALLSRVNGELARRGDSRAAREIHETVAQIEREQSEIERESRHIEREARAIEREGPRIIHRVGRHSGYDRDTGDSSKIAALNALMMMDPDKAMPVIRQIIVDDKPENRDLRRNVVYILGQNGDEESEVMLIDLAKKDSDPELQTEVIMWLGHSGSERSLDAVMDIYRKTDDDDVRESAMFALGQNGGERAVTLLKEIALDEKSDPDLRSNAVFSLTQSRTGSLGPFLMEIYRGTEDRDVLESVIFGLSIIEEDVPSAWFEEIIVDKRLDGDLRGEAIFSASRQDAFTPDFLLKVYGNAEDQDVKSHVCYALAEMEEDGALDALLKIADQETDPEIREEIIFWIGRQNDERAAQYLLKIINDQ